MIFLGPLKSNVNHWGILNTEWPLQSPQLCGTDSWLSVSRDNILLTLFSINMDLKSSRVGDGSWVMIYLLSRALGLVLTKLNQETFLALMGLTGLFWLVDRPTPIRLEKPNVHFGLLVLHRVTGQESKSPCAGGTHARQQLPPPCVLAPGAAGLRSEGDCLCINIISPGLLFHLWTLASKEHWPYSRSLPLKRTALHCRLKWRHSSRNRSGQPLPKLNLKQSLERLRSQPPQSGLRTKPQSWALTLTSWKAALAPHSASLWALGNIPLRIGLSQWKGAR